MSNKISHRNSLVTIAAVILICAAQNVFPAPKHIDGTLKLGGIGIDQQYGSLASVQETYNIYDGFNVAQVLMNGYLGPKHYFTLNLRDINLDSRKGNFLYRSPGKFRFNSNYRQTRYVFDPDRNVTSDRKVWGFNLGFKPVKAFNILGNYTYNKRDGERWSYPMDTEGSWLGSEYDYTQQNAGVEAQWVAGRRGAAVRYDYTHFTNRMDEQTDRRGHLLSARFNSPCRLYDKWSHFLRFAYGKHDVVNAGVDFTLLNFQYTGIVKPIQWFQFKYNLYLNRIDDSATAMLTDNIQNNFDADFYYKYGRVFGGYGYEINDDDRVLTDYNTYTVGGTFDYRKRVYAKVSYANRTKTDSEKLTLLQDIETERLRADLKLKIMDELTIGGRFVDGERTYPDINTSSKGQWTNAYLDYKLPVWFSIWGDYVYRVEEHDNLVGTFDTNSHILTSKLTFDRVKDLYLGFGATYLRVREDLDIEKSILFFEAAYTLARLYHFEVKYNIFNYDDYVVTERYYTGNIVWFNVAYDFNLKLAE
jgi:hypothetical protein